jgi:hypothetical protein
MHAARCIPACPILDADKLRICSIYTGDCKHCRRRVLAGSPTRRCGWPETCSINRIATDTDCTMDAHSTLPYVQD